MGMYTEFVISTMIRDDPIVVPVLQYLTGEGDEPAVLPSHPFFDCPRWEVLFRCSSYYFVPEAVSVFRRDDIAQAWVLVCRSDLKNYDNEIAKFVDWMTPYFDEPPGTMIGYSRYEEDDDPEILRVPG